MPTVDNKVVQMTFKNEQFERGVKESLHSLEELKKALDLDKSAESLSNLEKIASSFDISGIAKGIDDIANRFTLLGNLGQEAFRRISSFALDEVHKVTSAITSMPRLGMDKYEQKNQAVQMIRSAMPDKSIEEIEAVLAKLNEYTDLTSYDFSAMANSIGKFVSAGIDLDVAERAMEGIANETASAGGEIAQANIAMYNLSQALAQGTVRLQDWRSLENQNLATKEFKEQIIETAYELGTLVKAEDKVGVTAKGNTVTFQNMAQTLQEGWFTSDVLIKVLEKYADRESDVGKKGFEAAKIAITLKQAMDAVKDAISTGWMTSFGYLFGNLEEAGDLFTRISDSLIDFTSQISETRNALLEGWHKGGKDGVSGYQKVIEGLSNTWAVFNGIVEAVKDAFKSIFGVLDSSGLIEASKAFADFTGKVKAFFGVWTEDAPEDYSFFTSSDNEEIKHVGKGVAILTKALKGIFSIAKAGLGVIKLGLQIAGTLFNLIKPIASGLLNVASAIGNVVSYIVELASAALSGEDALGKFGGFLIPLANTFQKVSEFIGNVSKTINYIVDFLRSGVGLDGLRNFFTYNGDPTIKKYGLFIIDLFEKIQSVAKKVKPVFDALSTVISNAFNAVKDWISGKVAAGLGALGTFLANLWKTISEGDYLTKILNGIGTALQVIFGIAAGAGYGVFALVKALVDGSVALFNFVKNSEIFKNFLNFISEKTKPVREFFSSVWQSLASISGRVGEFKSFSDIWTAFITAMKTNPIGKTFVPAILKARKVISDFVNKIRNLVDTVKNAFSLLKEFGDPKKALGFLSMTGNKDSGVVKILEFFEKVKSVFGGVKGAAGDAKNAVGGFFGNLIPNLKAFGQKIGEMLGGFFSVDTSGIQGLPQKLLARLQAFNPVIDWIKEKFSIIKDFITDPDKLLSHVVGALKGIGEFVINVFKNVNLGTIWDTAKTALGIYIMMTFAKSLKSFSESFGVLTGAIDKDEKDGFADKLRSIAITIAIVTAAIAGLAFIPAKEAAIGVGIMALALGVVAGAIIALNKFAPNTKGLGKGILSMALSIGAVIAAIAAAALLVKAGGDLTKPLLLVGGIMAALGVVAWAMNKFSKNKKSGSKGQAKTILAMCAGLYLIVKAVDKMAKVLKGNKGHEGLIIQSLIVVGTMLAALGAVAVLMSKHGRDAKGESTTGVASAILAMCTGLSSIVSAVGKMADVMKRYPDHFGGAYAMIMGLLAVIGGIAVALAIFSKDLDWKVSLASAAPIVAMGFFLDTIVKTMAEGIQKVSGVNPGVIEQFLIGVAEAVIAMIGTVAIFSKIGISGLAQAAAGIVLIMGAIGLGVDIVATFAADAIEKLATAVWIVGSSLSGFSDLVVNVNTSQIKTVMDSLTNTVLPAIANMVQNSVTIQAGIGAANDVWKIGVRLGLFQRSIKGITVDTGTAIKKLPEDIKATVDGINAIQGIDAAKDVLANLGGALKLYYGDLAVMTGETVTDENGNFDINKANEAFGNLAELTLDDDTIKKIKSYATDGENDLNSFAIGIENLGTALKQYGEDISAIDPDKVDTANKILDKVIDIDDHINPVSDVNFDVLNGKRKSITDFGGDIAALGGALGSYADSISGLNPGKVLMANVVIDAVGTLANNLPTTGGLWQMLTGEQKLGEFAANMNNLGNGLAQYAQQVSGSDFTNVDTSVTVVEGLARAQSILQRYGGLASLISGTAGLDSLGANLKGLGKSLVEFATDAEGIKNLKDKDFDQLMKAMDPIKKLAEAQSILQREGGLKDKVEGSSNLGTLGTGLEELGKKLIKFNAYAQQFDATNEHLANVMTLMERIVAMQAIVQNGNAEYDFVNVGQSFKTLIDWIGTTLVSDGDVSLIEKASTNLSLLFAKLAEAISTDTQSTDAMGTLLVNVAATFSEHEVDFENVGKNIDAGLARGINDGDSKALVVSAAVAVAQAAFKAACEALGINSPSKMFEWIGDMTIEGFTGSLFGGANEVEGASESLGQIAINGIKNVINGSSGSIADSSDDLIQNITGAVQNSADKTTAAVASSSENITQTVLGKIKDGLSQTLSNIFDDDLNNPVITPVLDTTNIEDGASQIGGLLNGQSVSVGADMAKNVMNGNGVTIVQGGAAEDHSPEIIASIQEMGDRITNLANEMAHYMGSLKVVMNTNALVGQIAPAMDRALGGYANRS